MMYDNINRQHMRNTSYRYIIVSMITRAILTVFPFVSLVPFARAGAPGVFVQNPVNYDDFPAFIEAVLAVVMKIGMPIVVLMIIFTGLSFVLARGNEKKLEDAKHSLVWTIVGAGILMGAWVLAQAVAATIKAIAD